MSVNLIFIIAIFVVIAIYDTIRYLFFGGRPATLSDSVYRWCKRHPIIGYIITFAMGALAWHLIQKGCPA